MPFPLIPKKNRAPQLIFFQKDSGEPLGIPNGGSLLKKLDIGVKLNFKLEKISVLTRRDFKLPYFQNLGDIYNTTKFCELKFDEPQIFFQKDSGEPLGIPSGGSLLKKLEIGVTLNFKLEKISVLTRREFKLPYFQNLGDICNTTKFSEL